MQDHAYWGKSCSVSCVIFLLLTFSVFKGSHEPQEEPSANDPNDVREVRLQVDLHCHSGCVGPVRSGADRVYVFKCPCDTHNFHNRVCWLVLLLILVTVLPTSCLCMRVRLRARNLITWRLTRNAWQVSRFLILPSDWMLLVAMSPSNMSFCDNGESCYLLP